MRVRAVSALMLFLLGLPAAEAALPPGFSEQELGGTWNGAVALHLDDAGRIYVVERAGRVWLIEDGQRLATPFLDVSQEVGGWRDYGLLGFALHPNFESNGYVYLLYVVDHHHLMYYGTPQYDPNADEYLGWPTQGRIARYTADPGTGRRTVIPSSRLVLLGDEPGEGFPIMHQSHGTGALAFGTDGTLLAVSGDGACYNHTDLGSDADTYYARALSDGIIGADQDIGALRSQYLGSLSGKLVRLDPDTGDGVPSNPFYDPAEPRSARSRTWALGLRNPYRFSLKPGTGSHDPADGNPGTFYLGDVGWNSSEDLHVVNAPGQNFGWPIFEGLVANAGYLNANVYLRDAPNPLFGTAGCTQQYFYARDLLKQESLAPISFPNPCNAAQPIPDAWTDGQGTRWRYVKGEHARPPLAWRSAAWAATFTGNDASFCQLGTAACSAFSGSGFGGNASTGGVWYGGVDFPAQYRNTYFHADYGGQWIRSLLFDAQDRFTGVQSFYSGSPVVFVTTHPVEGGLYYVVWGENGAGRVRKVSYTAAGNQAPRAVATPAVSYGPAPLAVPFGGSGSSDPEAQPLAYSWDFADGATSTQANPSHSFVPGGPGPARYDVRLRVTDDRGSSDDAFVLVSPNNTPPSVTITSPLPGQLYAMSGDELHNLTASIGDAEHAPAQLSCVWQLSLFHNNHWHDDPPLDQCQTTATLSPAGCDGNDYFWRARLTVSDAHGLATTRLVDVYPDCGGSQPHPDLSIAASDAPDPVGAGGQLTYSIAVTNNGSGDATGVAVTAGLPAGMSFVSASPALCTPGAGSVTCELGDVLDGATQAFGLVVRPTLAGPLGNTLGLTSLSPRTNPGDDQIVVTTNVSPNAAPTATPQTVTTAEDTAKAITLAGSDPEGEALNFSVVSNPAHGALSGSGAARSYAPAANYDGPDGFTFRVTDPSGNPSSPATVSISVTAVNDPPVAQAASATTAEDSPVAIALAGSDVDGDPLTFVVVTGPAHGTLSGAPPDLTYTPAANYAGPDGFAFLVSDGVLQSAPASVSISVTSTDDAPTAHPGAVATAEDSALAITLTGSDPEGQALGYQVVTGPSHGELSGSPPGVTYTPAADYYGLDAFTFRVTDAGGNASAPATLSILVTPLNDAPAALAASASTPEDTPLTLALAGTDVDGDPLTFTIVAGPAHGSLSGAPPDVTYTPEAEFNGPDAFTFRVSDGTLPSAPATVSIAVTPVNDPPLAQPQTLSVPRNAALVLTLTGSDPEGDPLGFAVVAGPSHGALSGVPPELTYTPQPDHVGPDSFVFSVTDPDGASATATVALGVEDVPEWSSQDVGAPALAGSHRESNGSFTLRGAGKGIAGASDQFRFVYRTLAGDGEIVARVIGVEYTSPAAKAGVMLRESLAADSRHVAMLLTPAGSALWQRRVTTGAGTAQTSRAGAAAPYWVRLTRSGDAFRGYVSSDGQSWTQVGTTLTLALPVQLKVGLCVTSRRVNRLASAVFDGVSLAFAPGAAAPQIQSHPGPVTVVQGQAARFGVVASGSPPFAYQWQRDSLDIPGATAASFTMPATSPADDGARFHCLVRNALGTATSAPATLSVLPADVMPPWQGQDVGAPALPGGFEQWNGGFTLEGAGRNVAGRSDQFHFVYRTLAGDGEIRARLLNVEKATAGAKAGLMMREGLAAGARHVAMLISAGAVALQQRRALTDGGTAQVARSDLSAPRWLRLTRAGDVFRSYLSSDGEAWTQLGGAVTLALPAQLQVGICVTSRSAARLATAMLDNVSVTP
jgi:uncharacterized repeat protein (TIGR01451 family)